MVLDGVGVGELPDAAEYGDAGSNTLAATAAAVGGLRLPWLEQLGLGNLTQVPGVSPTPRTIGAYGKAGELSAGKDSVIGHWEIAGIVSESPLPTYPDGFPPEVVDAFARVAGVEPIGNVAASGTEIIKALGDEHVRSGRPIVYTSADSVFQVAAHNSVWPVSRLHDVCAAMRAVLTPPHQIGRVIARPFTGEPGAYRRLNELRKDYPLASPPDNLLDLVQQAGLETYAVGKIGDLFASRSIGRSVHTASNDEAVSATLDALGRVERGLIFANLLDFDQLYGHRNDPAGFAAALAAFDARLPEILAGMRERDVLIITSDHGNDPVTPSTDHSREFVPVLCSGAWVKPGARLGVRDSMADVGATVCQLLGAPLVPAGSSFAKAMMLELWPLE